MEEVQHCTRGATHQQRLQSALTVPADAGEREEIRSAVGKGLTCVASERRLEPGICPSVRSRREATARDEDAAIVTDNDALIVAIRPVWQPRLAFDLAQNTVCDLEWREGDYG